MSENTKDPVLYLNDLINYGRSIGLSQRIDEGSDHDGRTVKMEGKEVLHFGSCGYMSLEFEPRIRQSAIDAINKYGMIFNCSRTYLSNAMYLELEDLLEKIFRRPTLVTPTTTLLHLAAMPVLVGTNDVVLLDQQVHSSVQLAAKVLKANGTQVDIVPHNNIKRIERKINEYKNTKNKIWYMGDGIYSMYGDYAPVLELERLLGSYEQFHCYLDDAHGLSWRGGFGRGYVLEEMENHERLFVATSLAKGFGSGGGAMAFPNRELKQLVRNCGGTQIFSGPVPIASLGAAVESAKMHLEPAFIMMQKELANLIEYCNKALEKQPLPAMSSPDSPIRFLGVGSTENGTKIVKRVMSDGYWFNLAHYPAVGPNHAGLRFMLTRKLQKEDVDGFCSSIKNAVEEVLGEDENQIAKIWKSFNKEYRNALIYG